MEEERVLVHESQRHKFGETTRLLLDFAECEQLVYPVRRCFSVAIHQGGSGTDSAAMSHADDVFPLRAGQFVTGKHKTYIVIENLRSGAGQRVETVVAQHGEIIVDWHAREFHHIQYFHGREGVNMDARDSSLYCAQNVAIVKRRQAMGQASLNTHFGCSQVPCIYCFFGNLLQAEKVRV